MPLIPVVVIAACLMSHRGEPWTALRIVGLALAVPSLALWYAAHVALGRSFSIRAKATELVTHGLYSKIRNPIYVFGSLGIAGFFLCLGRPYLLAIFVILVPLQLVRIKKEEAVLQEKFGDAYLEYKRKTWF